MNRSPGPLAATALVIASMIGTGTFTSLGFQLLDLNSAPQILFLWLLGGIIALCGALCYAVIAKALPRSGGEHHFLGELYHPSLGFMAGIISAIGGFAAPTAITAIAFGAYFKGAFPHIDPKLSASTVILLGALSHSFSASTSGRIQTAATALKLLLILAFIAAVIVLPGKGDIRWQPMPADDLTSILQPGFAIALIYVIYAYSGWNAAIYGLEEWKQAQRTVRTALVLGTSLVTALYIALQASFLKAAPVDDMKGVEQVGHIAAISLFGEQTAGIISGLFALGLFASVSALLWAGPRVLAAMGRSTPALSFFNQGQGVPRLALAFQTLLALTLVATTAFDSLIKYTAIALSLCTSLTVAGIFVLRFKKRIDIPRHTFFAATIFLAMTTFIIVRSIVAEPVPSLLGLGTVFLASLVWFPLQKQKS